MIVYLKELKLKALIDTGAEYSLINEQIIEENKGKFKNEIMSIKNVNLITANGKKINTVRKQLNSKIILGKSSLITEILIVPDMNVDIIIGMNILNQNNIIINLELGHINCYNNIIPLIKQESEKNKKKLVEANVNCCHKEVQQQRLEESVDSPEELKENVKELLNIYKNLCDDEPGYAKGYEHKLEVNKQESFHNKSYPIPNAYREKVNKEINSLLDQGIIEKARTSYINPIVVVKKQNGDIRLCLDARQINARTVPQFESPQNIECIMGKLGNKTIFSKLDLRNSFWLIPLEEQSRKYCGFSINGNIYQFRMVPFGLSTSCAALVRAMQQILDKYETFCSHYIDDIIIYSNSIKEHWEHLNIILKELEMNGLKLNIKKCEFFKKEVKFLGYVVNVKGITIDKERLEEIKNYPRPKNIRMLRGFIGVLNYYRKFVENLAEYSGVLTELLKKGTKFNWKIKHEEAFNILKEKFYEGISIYHPDYQARFILRTDASDTAIAAELIQIRDGIEVPICFISRILKDYERRYTISEKEMAAIVFSVIKLKYYLLGNKFTLETDHGSLVYMMNSRFANNRVYRWSLLLQEFVFEIKHIAGNRNIVADGLSRKDTELKENSNNVLIALNYLRENQGIFSENYIYNLQNQNDELNRIKNKIRNEGGYRGLMLINGFICKKIGNKELYLTNKEHTEEIIKFFHEEYGHTGIRRLWMMFRENYFSKNDLTIIKNVIRLCHLCCLAKYKNHINKNVVKSIRVYNPLELVAVDFLSNLVRSGGYKHMMVMVDVFSKYTKIYPCKANNTNVAIKCIEKFIDEVGKPKRILADNATYFTNQRFKNHFIEQDIKISFCSIRHPQGNPSERYIQEVIKYLRILIYYDQHINWYHYVEMLEKFINEVPSTVTGETPFFIINKINPTRPWETEIIDDEMFEVKMNKVRDRIRKINQDYERNENKKIKKHVKFEVGDKVVVKHLRVADRQRNINAKLLLPYEGPYSINKIFGNSYELKYLDKDKIRGRFNIQLLYPYPRIC